MKPKCIVSWRAKLTPLQVREIRMLHRQGWTGTALAAKFGVSASTISQLLNERTYLRVA